LKVGRSHILEHVEPGDVGVGVVVVLAIICGLFVEKFCE